MYTVCLQWIWHVARKCWHDNKTICASSSEIFPRHETFMLTFLLCAFDCFFFCFSPSLQLLKSLNCFFVPQTLCSSSFRNNSTCYLRPEIFACMFTYTEFSISQRPLNPFFPQLLSEWAIKHSNIECNDVLWSHVTKYFWQVILGQMKTFSFHLRLLT